MANIAIRVTITLESSLLITAQQIGFVRESESFIPGSVLRGSVAQIMLANCILNEEERRAPESALGHQEKCDFHRIFYADQPPLFGHAYPGLEPPIGVLPQTARTCKQHGGFIRDDADNERHGAFDTLIRQFLCEKNGSPLIPRCPFCSQKAEPIIGRVYAKRGDRYASPKALHRRLAHTAVGRESGAVAEGLLYTIEALSEQMDRDELDRNGDSYPPALSKFHSVVWVDEADAKKLGDVLRQVHHIGAAVSRGMGQVRIETSRASTPVTTDEHMDQAAKALSKGIEPKPLSVLLPKEADWLERLLAFNSAWADEQKSAINGWYFTLDLQSDMLLFREDGPSYTLDPDQIGLQGKVELIRAFASSHQIGGWSSAWLMPKPIAPAIAAGSVFLYHVPGDNFDLARIVLERLAVLEREGVGQRREEGYGWLQVCTPFHLEIEVR